MPDRTTIESPVLRECMRETMFAAEFDPPSEGGRVTVAYPFKFRPRPDDADGELHQAPTR